MTEPRDIILEDVESVIIRFAGDSGDGMQLTGTQFSNTAAIFGNDISTMPDFPAEIRAPAGTLAGVSGFQVNFSSADILTPGDAPEVLVAMNPAALKANLPDLQRGGKIIVNTDNFTSGNLKKANYDTNPLEDGSLRGYEVYKFSITTLNRKALEGIPGLNTRDIDRCQNFFALGLTFWMYDRPLDTSMKYIADKFAKKPELVQANQTALQAGYSLGHNTEAFQTRYHVRPARLAPGVYRKITGNEALVLGMVTAAQKAGKPLFYGSYPITPASSILESLAALKNFDVRTFQAEDEIAAMGSVIGAAFGGAFAATGTSGPGIALKSEAINLALVLELPMVIINVQRGGPSTGMPTKTEQSDLLQAMYGRNGESPIPILAPATPSDCFNIGYEAFRLAVRATTPVFILSDGYIANSAEPWLIPNPDDIEPIVVNHPSAPSNGDEAFKPYQRDPETMARPWALPGTPGLEHRIGGLSKQPETGNVSYAPQDNDQMIRERAEKVARLAEAIPPQTLVGPSEGDLLVVSWGGTFGVVRSTVLRLQAQGKTVSHAHLRYLNPFPSNLGDILGRFERILVPELNMGQLAILLRGRYGLQNVIPLSKVQGRPFTISEITQKIEALLASNNGAMHV
ncbi:MAG: 2-oxoacid:acceptor oxidoreductase subunit alpha [Anaerolineae bacterium]|nr:2-oxoacid:acceptor oxidoreductase subunit alpha [Anaerolineales bacterium]MCQ3978581.1 2-oxoglutarate ferredoxin oxidoreductase subunit alpha [Anaerolineae bacterium]